MRIHPPLTFLNYTPPTVRIIGFGQIRKTEVAIEPKMLSPLWSPPHSKRDPNRDTIQRAVVASHGDLDVGREMGACVIGAKKSKL